MLSFLLEILFKGIKERVVTVGLAILDSLYSGQQSPFSFEDIAKRVIVLGFQLIV